MSKAALYKGLSAGLATFGQGMAQQIAQNAEQRRKESLLALQRQWKMEDRAEDREYQQGLLDQQYARQDAMTAEERAYQEQVRAEELALSQEEWEREAPQRQARIGLLEAQTESTLNRNETPTNRIDLYDRFYEDLVSNQGKPPEQAHEEATRRVQQLFSTSTSQADPDRRLQLEALEQARNALSGDFPQDKVAQFFPDNPDMPVMEATEELARRFYQQSMNLSGGQAESDGSRNNPIPVESLSGPSDLVQGHFYMVNGELRQWTGSEWR
jgi:hypothetical protein